MSQTSPHDKPGRRYITASLVIFTLFVGDIVIAKTQVLLGRTLPLHLGDTFQFLVLLAAVVLFVMGTLAREKSENKAGISQREPGD
ncbi:MAG: hypothetical protein ACE5H7_08515 [Acidiferrobacterales bacterium]